MNEIMNYFLDPITKHYVDFDGKATRKQFWMFTFISIIIQIFIIIFVTKLWLDFLWSIYWLLVFLPSLAITIRRLHDINKSWWWVLISFIPFIWIIWLIVLLASSGKVEFENTKSEENNIKNL